VDPGIQKPAGVGAFPELTQYEALAVSDPSYLDLCGGELAFAANWPGAITNSASLTRQNS
jgi:hypothetical protein